MSDDPAIESVARTAWWLVLLRGILAILFGIFVLSDPGGALLTIVLVYGVYAVLDGIAAIVLGVQNRRQNRHGTWQIFNGIIGILAGIVAFTWPGFTVLVALLLIAAWAVLGGITQILAAFDMRRVSVPGWGWALAAGVVAVLVGVALFAQPGAGLVTLLLLIGLLAVVTGVLVVVESLRLRRGARAVAG